jgi:hypothetical protein
MDRRAQELACIHTERFSEGHQALEAGCVTPGLDGGDEPLAHAGCLGERVLSQAAFFAQTFDVGTKALEVNGVGGGRGHPLGLAAAAAR